MCTHWYRAGIGVALAVMLAVPVAADAALALDDAITQGLAQHPLIAAAAADIGAANASARGARALPNPEVVVAHGVVGPAGADEFLAISQPLDLSGTRRVRARMADGQVAAARAGATATRLELIRAITVAYWDAVLAQAALALDDENVAHVGAIVAAAKKQVELGNEPATHAMKAEVELVRAQQQAMRARTVAAQAIVALNAAMGRDPAMPVTLPATLTFAPLVFDDAALLGLALTHRPEIVIAGADVAAAQGESAMAALARRPDAALQVRQEAWGGAGGIGVVVSLPLVDWGSARAERQRTQAAIMAAEQRLEAARNTVRAEVVAALAEMRGADAQVRALQGPALTQTERLADLAMIGYREGATSYLEVLEARRTLRAVKSEYLAALAEHRKALAQLAWAVGAETLSTPEKG